MIKYFIPLLFAFIFYGCQSSDPGQIYKSDYLEIIEIKPNLFVHISHLDFADNKNISCNGMVYFSDQEAVVFDTPANDISSGELISWVEKDQNKKINHVIINHFHKDCLGGLRLFHSRGIDSYSSRMTIDLARENDYTIPSKSFDKLLISEVGRAIIITEFLGEAHSKDNTISYIPVEKVIFGGCMIKSLQAGEGNLTDANISEWANTVEKVKQKYPDVEVVVPGHGKYGGMDLIIYTINLFQE